MLPPNKRRVIAYVDGFNLYHSVKKYNPKKINLWALFEELIKPEEVLVGVKYFSAYAHHRGPNTVQSHRAYVAQLEATGVTVIRGQFKKKPAGCRTCGARWNAHEEKETDLNIGLHLLADATDDNYDRAYLISADSDLVAAVKMVRTRHNDMKGVLIIKPPGRHTHGRELGASGNAEITLQPNRVKRNMF